MNSLLRFLKQIQHIIFFVLLESVAIVVYLQSDYLLKARTGFLFKRFVIYIEEQISALTSYLSLREQNEHLVTENIALRNELAQRRLAVDVLHQKQWDSVGANQYHYIGARVVSNTVVKQHNYFVLDVGKDSQVKNQMPVLAGGAVAGIVLATSQSFSVAISLLNTDLRLSAKLQRTGYYGSLWWDGVDCTTALLLDIPHHVDVQLGDTIVTTGYSNIFPQDLFVGVVENIEERGGDFNIVRVRLACDFRRMHYVTLVEDRLKIQRDSMEQALRWDE
ncbi:MAG: rod shape-determining protein MreC [Bacteroides sp.]